MDWIGLKKDMLKKIKATKNEDQFLVDVGAISLAFISAMTLDTLSGIRKKAK